MKTISEPGRDIEVISEVDVAVVGGGCAGLGAALAAARNGAKVALIERLGFLGGCVTATHMDVFWLFRAGDQKAVEGIGMETLWRLKGMGALQGEPGGRAYVDVEKFKLLADRMTKEAGIELWLHSWGVTPVMEGTAVRGVVTESKSGRKAILAKTVVDVSGDADIAARAGAPTVMGRESDGLVQPVSNSFRLSGVDVRAIRKYGDEHPEDRYFDSYVAKARAAGDLTIQRRRIMYHGFNEDTGELTGINVTRVQRVDPTNVRDLTQAEVTLREQVFQVKDFLRKYVPGFEKVEVAAISTQLAPRESRRVIGGYVLKEDDLKKGARFPDVVAVAPCFVDLHDPVGDATFWIYPGNVKPDKETKVSLHAYTIMADATTYDIPYRTLVPNDIENLLVAGRCISAEHIIVGSVRYLPISFATGQAAGTAAALAARQNKTPRDVDVALLQKTLSDQGAYLGEAATARV